MTKVWKSVLIAVLVLLAAAILCAGTGWITGASPDRVLVALGAEERLRGLLTAAGQFRGNVLDALNRLFPGVL